MIPVSTQANSAIGHELPTVIQGGMGATVSSWRLASQVAQAGRLGVVSGVGLDLVLARRLQDGDQGGHVRRALAAFPVPAVAARATKRYYLPEGRAAGYRRAVPPDGLTHPSRDLLSNRGGAPKSCRYWGTSLRFGWPRRAITAWSASTT
jgi:NAD(P)H-dependent flavin oxidoreductase YrpB (nitropropane dioxygenase family)